jgi:hypothetical protein
MRKLWKPFLGITLLAEHRRDAKPLIRAINSTSLARVVFFSRMRGPEILTREIFQGIRESNSKGVVIVANPNDSGPMVTAVKLLVASTLGVPVLVSGDLNQYQAVVAAVRSGATQYVDRNADRAELDLTFARWIQPPPDEDMSSPFTPPDDSGPSGGTWPPAVLVGVRRPRGPKTLPPRKELPEESRIRWLSV